MFPPKLEKAHPPPENEKRDTNKTRSALNCPIVFSECSVMNAQKKENKTFFFFYDQLLFCVSRQPTLLLCVSVVLFVTNVATRLFCVHTGVVVVSRGAESEYQMTFRSTRTNHKRAQLPTRHRTAELYTKSFTNFFFCFLIFSRGGISRSVVQLFSRP